MLYKNHSILYIYGIWPGYPTGNIFFMRIRNIQECITNSFTVFLILFNFLHHFLNSPTKSSKKAVQKSRPKKPSKKAGQVRRQKTSLNPWQSKIFRTTVGHVHGCDHTAFSPFCILNYFPLFPDCCFAFLLNWCTAIDPKEQLKEKNQKATKKKSKNSKKVKKKQPSGNWSLNNNNSPAG